MVHFITHHEAKAMMDQSNQELFVLDVREIAEYDEVHIPDSHVIPLPLLAGGIEQTKLDKDACILIYCRSGRRSKEAARILDEMGYTNVYEFGGIIDWPYEVVRK